MDNSIAIVGMSCRFAECRDIAELWSAIMSRRSCLTVPGHDVEIPYGQKNVFERAYPTRIGQLGPLYACTPSMQNFPRQVNAGENQDLYFATQLAFEALLDASLKPHTRERRRGSVRVGYAPPFNASTVNWLQHTYFLNQTLDVIRRFFPNAPEEALDNVREKLVSSLPEPNASSFLLGAGYRFASWLARECSFSGAAMIMDAGMISGAATIMDAISDLESGRADIAVTGAINPPMSRAYLEGLSGEVQFSLSNSLQPFSKDDDGTIPGEGGAFFVLKRRSDALRDHDRIYALIRSVAVGHNTVEDPSLIIREAAEQAKVPIKTISLIEADGSGIRESDEREIDAIDKLWGKHKPGAALVGIGSVKGNVGHTLRASMAAGMVKTALALHHRILPPQVVVDHPMEAIRSIDSSVYLLSDPLPWITGDSSNPRRALVTGSNFDPVNPVGVASVIGRSAAIILEEEPEVRS
ncbi:MAG: polyketide synthase [Kiritimatiellae bacterium]|nr:polyketide synthase [Kiritimatiellia bacterium]